MGIPVVARNLADCSRDIQSGVVVNLLGIADVSDWVVWGVGVACFIGSPQVWARKRFALDKFGVGCLTVSVVRSIVIRRVRTIARGPLSMRRGRGWFAPCRVFPIGGRVVFSGGAAVAGEAMCSSSGIGSTRLGSHEDVLMI